MRRLAGSRDRLAAPDRVRPPLLQQDGYVTLPTTPGLGIDLDEDALRAHGVVLVVLVAHLVGMATPLHHLVMHPDRSTEISSVREPQGGVGLQPGAQVAETDDAPDCAIVWTVLPQRALGLSPTTAAVSTVSLLLVDVPHDPRRLPRTLSPPPGADWQPLLQVFRI